MNFIDDALASRADRVRQARARLADLEEEKTEISAGIKLAKIELEKALNNLDSITRRRAGGEQMLLPEPENEQTTLI